jgi:hypothetical protein
MGQAAEFQPALGEGTVNRLIGRRMGKSQRMCWTKRGAHLLLQVRCAVQNGDLLAGLQRWFPTVGTRRIMLPWDWLPSNRNGSCGCTSYQTLRCPQLTKCLDAI